MVFSAKYYGSNTWLLEFGQTNILVDPWFVGSLILGPGKWFFEGKLLEKFKVPKKIDLILLTQGLEDHTHIKTLNQLDKNIPIICSNSGFQNLKNIGFKHVINSSPGKTENYKDIIIRTICGARVPNQENGYIINNKNTSLYIEPHGFFDNNLTKEKLDIIISPFMTLSLPLAGDFIRGDDTIRRLIENFNPNYVIATITGENVSFEGVLNKFIIQKTLDLDSFKNNYKQVSFIMPRIGKSCLTLNNAS